jgi:hypothetical protein
VRVFLPHRGVKVWRTRTMEMREVKSEEENCRAYTNKREEVRKKVLVLREVRERTTREKWRRPTLVVSVALRFIQERLIPRVFERRG